jgi:hypothetical protein
LLVFGGDQIEWPAKVDFLVVMGMGIVGKEV